MIYARQSTAIIVTVGPVLDADGVAVTGGVVADFKISKNGAAPAALNGSATLTHRHTGFYSLSLTATDVNTVGTAEIVIDDTVNCCPMKEIQVVEPAVYDAWFADAAVGIVDLVADVGDIQTKIGTPSADLATDLAAVKTDTAAALSAVDTEVAAIKTKTDFLPSATAGAAGGLTIAGSNAATTFATLTSTGVFSINGTSNVAQTGDSFARIGALGAGLTAADDATLAAIAALNNLSSAQVQAAADAALVALHLDHLLAADYDPASKPGVATALFNELIESDAGVSRYTANALEQAPTGAGGDGSAFTAIPWNAAWDAEVQSECTDALNAYDPPTNAEMEARTIVAANYSTLTAAQILTTALTESYAADGATATLSQLLYMIWCAVNEFSIAGVTITGKKVDGSTTAMTWTMDSSSAPTSRTRTT